MATTRTKDTVLVKTQLGQAELKQRSSDLTLTERRVLIMADGSRSVGQLQQLLGDGVLLQVTRLESLGLLGAMPGGQSFTARAARDFPATQPSPLGGSDLYPEPADRDEASADDLARDFADERVSTFGDGQHSEWIGGADGRWGADSSSFASTGSGMQSDFSGADSRMHRAASERGLSHAKAYLIQTVDRLLGAEGTTLIRKISSASSESDLYFTFERVIGTIKQRTTSSEVVEIMRTFDYEISRH